MSGVDLIEMTLKGGIASGIAVHTTVTLQAFNPFEHGMVLSHEIFQCTYPKRGGVRCARDLKGMRVYSR